MLIPKEQRPLPIVIRRFIPTRTSRLRMLAHTRHIVLVTLPLGAGTGFLVALALRGLGSFEPMVLRIGGRTGLTILLPAIGLFLTTAWLSLTGIGEVSLFKDIDLARKNPYKVFPFLTSLGKIVACALTIGFGGSAGVEGPGKWLGAALGLQYHRFLRAAAVRATYFRHLARPALVMVRSGAAAALAAVFRAPLSGALMAAEHHGLLSAESLVPCLVSAASGYVVFSGFMGYEPLLPMPRAAFAVGPRELLWALPLGLATVALLVFWVPRIPCATTAARRLSWHVPRQARAYLGIVFAFSLANSSDAFLVLRAREAGFSIRAILVAFLVFNLLAAALALPVGRLSDRFGRVRFLALGWLVYGVTYAIMGTAATPAVFLAALLGYGAFYGFTEGVEKALLADLLSAEARGTGFGALQSVLGLGALLASPVMGLLMAWAGAKAAFLATAGLALAAMVALVVWGRWGDRT